MTARVPHQSATSHDYGWERFWVSRDGHLDLSDAGFLVDPTREGALYRDQGLYTLTELGRYRGIGLLGEPGIGKSTTLNAQYERQKSESAGAGDVFIHLNLRSFASDTLFHNRLFESAEFVGWAAGASHLYLYLDSG
jgi:hypothetical protein